MHTTQHTAQHIYVRSKVDQITEIVCKEEINYFMLFDLSVVLRCFANYRKVEEIEGEDEDEDEDEKSPV